MNGDLNITRPSIRLMRLRRGMSQQALAEITGLSQSRVCHIERGIMVDEVTAEIVAKALNCETSDLFPEFEDPKQERAPGRALKRRKVQ